MDEIQSSKSIKNDIALVEMEKLSKLLEDMDIPGKVTASPSSMVAAVGTKIPKGLHFENFQKSTKKHSVVIQSSKKVIQKSHPKKVI